jgi:hypothetical protein
MKIAYHSRVHEAFPILLQQVPIFPDVDDATARKRTGYTSFLFGWRELIGTMELLWPALLELWISSAS